MSAAGRFILLFSGFSVIAYAMSFDTGTLVTDPPDRVRQEGRSSNSGKPVFGWSEEPSFTFIEPTLVTIVERPVKRSVALDQSLVPLGRDAIGRELQKELKRVGCYAGEVNGVWTTSTRHAMKAFTDRVNAKLPTDKPDNILLALVQGYPSKVCGIPCPSGQSLSRAQECIPNVLLGRPSGTKFTSARGQRLTTQTSAWTVKTTAVSGVTDPPAGTEPPGALALVEPPSSSTGPALQEPAPHRVLKKYGQPPARHEGRWTSNLFNQTDRSSLN